MWNNTFIGNESLYKERGDPMEGRSVLRYYSNKSTIPSSYISITISWQFETNLTKNESKPLVYLDTNLHYGIEKAQMLKYDVSTHRKLKSETSRAPMSKVHKVIIAYPKGKKLPADASVWFHTQARQKSSEDNYLYENTGSTRVLLADMLSVDNEDDREFTYKHSGGMIVHQHAVKMACLKYGNPDVEPKGYIHAWLHSVNGESHIKMKSVQEYDWIPKNDLLMQKLMFVTIEKNMGVFASVMRKDFAVKFDPISRELKHVHAPLYSTPVVTLPGWAFFARLTQESNPSEEMHGRLARVVLSRTKISDEDFIKMCELPKPSATPKEYPMRLHQAAAIVIMMSTVLPNSIPYIGDYAYVSYPTERGSKMTLPQRGKHPKGFRYGVGKFFHLFTVHSGKRISDESFDDALLRKSGDCEDLAALVLRVASNIQYGKWNDPVLIAAQKVARHYAFCATLGSVTARNLKEGGTHHSGRVVINSREDKESGFGAHMWVTAVPLARLGEMTDLNNGNAYSKGEIKLPNGYTCTSVHGKWDKRFPLGIGEGTGSLYPLPLSPEAYFEDKEGKAYMSDQLVKSQEAYARLETGLSIKEIKARGGSAEKYPIFRSIETMKRQKAVRNNKNVRPSSFYRDISSMFFLDGANTNPTWKGWHSSDVSLPKTIENNMDAALTDPSWKLVRPVQVGTREEDIGTEDEVGNNIIRHGTPVADMLNKRKHVGVLIEGLEPPNTLLAMASAARHLPAPKSMDEFTPEEDDKLETLTSQTEDITDRFINDPRARYRKDWERDNLGDFPELKKLGIMGILEAKSLSADQSIEIKNSNLHMTQCFKKMLDDDAEKVSKEFVEQMSKNKYVLGAKVHGEKLVNGISNIRFDVIVDTSDRVHDDPSVGWEKNPAV